MDANELNDKGKKMIDFVSSYWQTIRSRRALSVVEPGYLDTLLPNEAPLKAELWEDVLRDVEQLIMPGITHWHSPHFHAYFPTGNSYPAICADILSDAIGCIGFSWISSPACTELEMKMMKWLGKLINLPSQFYTPTNAGGVIQGTASEATLVSLLAARSKVIKDKNLSFQDINSTKMVVYCSDQAHSSVERAVMLLLMQCRKILSDSEHRMNVKALSEAIKKDLEEGLTPTMCVATLGTTSTCSFDDLTEIGKICNEQNVWMHVDAAYAGASFICPEYQYLMEGVQYADTFNFNPHKWMLINFDCSALWFKDSSFMVEAFNVDPVYLQHVNQKVVLDYRHWQVPLGRRFRSLKLWFTMRLLGVEQLQNHIRKSIKLAKDFEKLVCQNPDFEVVNNVILGLVCFRMKGDNSRSKKLLEKITADGKIYLVPSEINGVYFIRFAICSWFTNEGDVNEAWSTIESLSKDISMQETF
ncbi:hypothetical protein HELRODRAFT_186120 [Helobdella robusta]|uniref:Aromatic-L-amino-acid decarboxylase n=1 Tax=Helobdella robusta TaxID=6412 RepID=T1FNP3_HELRO|nr:hypothetical protein HELRODRAFT_186120 [Helobdella robusta]ESN93210.1 hypothetical protein HELRODRAFT_186120 [Helobdella robusta]